MFTTYAPVNERFTQHDVFLNRLTPSNISVALFDEYREAFTGLFAISEGGYYHHVRNNASDSLNGYGLHEKYIHNGRSVMDVSVGVLDFPWTAADANFRSEISLSYLEQLASEEEDDTTATRMYSIISFCAHLPPYTRIFYFSGSDGTKAITLVDDFNLIKANAIVSYQY